jgi:hypothetical protein
MLFIELDVDSLRLALLGSAPYDPSKRTRLDVSLRLISAYTFMAEVMTNEGRGEEGEAAGRRTPQK